MLLYHCISSFLPSKPLNLIGFQDCTVFPFLSSLFSLYPVSSLTRACCCGSFAEAVRLSDPRVHQALHRPQLATETRQGSLSQRASREGQQGNTS